MRTARIPAWPGILNMRKCYLALINSFFKIKSGDRVCVHFQGQSELTIHYDPRSKHGDLGSGDRFDRHVCGREEGGGHSTTLGTW